MKAFIALVALLISLALIVMAMVHHPYFKVVIVTPPQTEIPEYSMPTFDNARTPAETALAVRSAILKGDFKDADKVLSTVLAKDDPYSDDASDFLALIIPANTPAFPYQLGLWIQADKDSHLPYMLRAGYYFNTGLLFRGNDFVKNVPPERISIFNVYLAYVWNDLKSLKEKDDHSVWLYTMAMKLLQYVGHEEEQEKLFEEATHYHPGYYPLYRARLIQLAPKWGGSVKRMIEFVNHNDVLSLPDKRFHMLTLDLYLDLMRDIDINCSGGNALEQKSCTASINDFLLGPSLQKSLSALFGYYAKNNLYLLNDKLISDICFCSPRAMTYQRPLLVTLTQATSEQNYVLPYIRGNIQYYGKDLRKALDYYHTALLGAQSFTFPSESARSATLGSINSALYEVSNDLQNKGDAVSYAQTAVEMEPANASYQATLCFAYFQNNALDDALRSCTASIALQDNSRARNIRADTYINRQSPDKAIADLKAELSYNDIYKARDKNQILFMLAFVYKANKRYTDEIKLFDDYPEFLGKDARLHEWRCEAYKAIGGYAKALEECNASLAIDNDHRVTVQRDAIQAAMEHTTGSNPVMPLIAAIDAHKDELAKELISKGAEIDEPDAYGHTPLMEAIDKNDWPVAELLVEHHADSKHQEDDEGQDALYRAVVNYCGMAFYMCPEHSDNPVTFGIIRSLLEAGAKPEHENKAGKSAFAAAVFLCHVPVVKLMLEHGAKINYREKFSSLSPIQIAATTCGPDMITLLLQYHPDLTYRAGNGDTALDLANKRSDHVGPYNAAEVVRILKTVQPY